MEAQALSRLPGPHQDLVPLDELLLALRRNISSADSAVARALSDPNVWDQSMVWQLTRGIDEGQPHLRNQVEYVRLVDLVKEAEALARKRGARRMGERDLADALVSHHRQALLNAGVRLPRFSEVISGLEDADEPLSTASAQPPAPQRTGPEIDFFISHASEDKDDIARPLAEALIRRGFEVWFDEYELQIGDSLRRRIDDGLARSRYGVVVLSPHFFAKQWTQIELDGLAAQEVSSGTKRILPVWHHVSKADVLGYSPPLADKLGAATSMGVEAVADEIASVIGDKTRPRPGSRAPLVHSFEPSSNKRDRLQPEYAALLRMAIVLDQIADEASYLRDGETAQSRERRWQEVLAPLRADADRAVVALRLETGTDEVLRAFYMAVNTQRTYLDDLSNNRFSPGSVPLAELGRQREQLRGAVEDVERLARDHLDRVAGEGSSVHVEVAGGIVGQDPYVFVTVYNDSTRPQRVDLVSLRMSDDAGDLARASQTPFADLPQVISETANYQTAFPLAEVLERVGEARKRTGRGDIRVVAARVRLASGREVVADARHVRELEF